jgi:hypothetical protein
MDSELNGNQASFDAVRARAGLPSKPLTDENLRNERRWELAFEGVRYGDMRRYGEAYAVAALNKQDGVDCYNSGVKGTNHATQFNGGYGTRYSKTKGLLPFHLHRFHFQHQLESSISISRTKDGEQLIQNLQVGNKI